MENVETGGLKRFTYLLKKRNQKRKTNKKEFIKSIITLRGYFGKLRKNITLELVRLDNNFYDRVTNKLHGKRKSKIDYKGITNETGELKIDKIEKGKYLIKIFQNGKINEKIIDLKENVTLKIPPFLINNKILSPQDLMNNYEIIRTDRQYCAFCDGKYLDFTDKHDCKYCNKFYCEDHRLPEDHKCKLM